MDRANDRRQRNALSRLLGILTITPIAFGCWTISAAAAPTTPPPGTPTAAAAANKATFGIGPANTKRLDGRPFLTYLVSPGSRLSDHAAIVNLATKAVTLNLYVADAAITSDGRFGYLARSAPRADAATWISLATPGHTATITIGPRATEIVPVVISVPRDAAPGDHAAGVITSLTSNITSKDNTKANFEQRVALRAYIRVSGPLHPRLAIEKLRVKYHGTLNPAGRGKATISYTVRNTGNVRLGAQQQVIISGLFGAKKAKPLADVPLLLPKSSVAVSVTVPGVFPQLHMTGRVVLVPLKVAGDVDPALPAKITASTTFWAIPWALIAALALLLCASALWAWRRRRSRRPPAAPPSGRHRGGPDSPDDEPARARNPQTEGVRT
jgi:hypothetical protein